MTQHIKPTKEELTANAAAALEKLKNLPPENGEPSPSAPVPSPSAPPAEPSPSTPVPSPSPSAPVPSKADPRSGIDYKKRYSDQMRETQVIAFKNKEINKAIDDAGAIKDISPEELKQEFPEWEEMTVTEQRLAKDNLLNKKRFDLIHGATQKFKQVEDWAEKVDTFVDDPKTLIANPELEGKQGEFKIFASKATRRGVDFEDLILAFLGEEAKNKKPSNKGKQMFEKGSGGSKQTIQPPDDKITVAQADALRKTNYPEFKRLLKAGKIKSE